MNENDFTFFFSNIPEKSGAKENNKKKLNISSNNNSNAAWSIDNFI